MLVVLQLVAIIFLATLGGVVWRQRPNDSIHRNFLIFSVSLNFWIISGILSNIQSPYALLLNKAVFVFPLILVWSAMTLAIKLSKQNTVLIPLVGISVAAVSAVILATNSVVAGIIGRYDAGSLASYDIDRGFAYPVYLAYLIAVALTALVYLFVRWRNVRRRERDQLSIVGLGLLGCLVVGLFTSVLLPIVMNSSAPASYSFLSAIVSTVFFAYAIVKYDLFDIKLVAVRSVVYGGVLVSLSAIYYLLAYVVTVIFFHGSVDSSFSISPVNILLALVLAFIFQPIKQFFDKLTDKIFYRAKYSTEDFFASISKQLTSSNDLHTLLERVSKEVAKTLKASSAQFFVYYHNGHEHHMSSGTDGHSKIPAHDARLLDDFFTNDVEKDYVLTEFAEDKSVHRMLVSHGINLVVPLRTDKIVGYLLLGDHKSSSYKKRDLTVLLSTRDELVIGIQNALSLHEVRELNATLQQRIDVATKELRSSNAQLKHLDEVKDEFMSMASHQLRTPLTSVKGYISMVLEGDAGRVTPQQQKLLVEAFKSSERMVGLIADFLNVSRLQTGKFLIEKTPFDLKEVVRQEVSDLNMIANSHDIKLRAKLGSGHFPVLADEQKVRQVIMNFIDNAVYYSHPRSTIIIKLERVKDMAAMTVIDTGIGVPADEQSKLFNKFFRAHNARKARPDGTGVGLYLARRVLSAHNGQIIFSSEEGKGSTFGFRLPIKEVAEITAKAKEAEPDLVAIRK